MRPPLILYGNNVSEEIQFVTKDSKFTPVTASIGKFISDEPFVELFPKQEDTHAENRALLKGSNSFVIQSTNEPVNDNSQQLKLMAHTLKHYGAQEVTAILPFGPFERQDREFKNRFTSMGLELFVKELKAAGINNVIRITPHSQDAINTYKQEFGNCFTALSTTKLFADDIKARFGDNLANISIGAPDGADKPLDAGQQRAKELAEATFGGDNYQSRMFKIAKTHIDVNETKVTDFKGDVKDKHCIIVDDMIDGGSTMIKAAILLKEQGASTVTAYATHGIFSNVPLESRVGNFCEFVASDTLSADQKQAASEAINNALGLKGDERVTPETLATEKSKLVSSITELCLGEPDNFAAFINTVKEKLEDSHPLKNFEPLSDSSLENLLSKKTKNGVPVIDNLSVTDTIPSVVQKISKLSEIHPELAKKAHIVSVGKMISDEIERQHALESCFVDSIKLPDTSRKLG